ncbi:site-specific integrase [Ancylomarina sp. 16SWW S1-10-2]|uniref:site-specific integrase n=1 Tax=Ancylomarina sp. 16SWW S1-10-2 TaxID=2499681 RepID=UPI0012AD48DB|nr:site-specific integrase [Ancylomarina sp. 16SWW S1-10-2]MRT91904.1 site-specific integrase [Ancylomarina sp. 16SWW S1-10-2]
MNSRNTLGILLHIRKDKLNKKKEAPIFLRVTVNGKRAEISTKQYVDPDKWNSDAGEIKGNKEEIKVKNQFLLRLKSKAHKIYQDLILENDAVTSAKIKEVFFDMQKPSRSLLDVFKIHNQTVKERVGIDYSSSTYRRYETTLDHVKNFIKYKYAKDDIYLSDLNYQFIEDLSHYFKTVRKCNHNTSVKYIKNLKKVIFLAIKREWLGKDPFIQFSVKLEETKRVYLSREELERVESKVFKIARLEQIRDFFIFSCYTGYPYSEIEKLIPRDVQTHFDGSKWIITSRTKNDIQSNVPLLAKAEEIIEKYKNHPDSIMRGKLFPIPSNVKYNAYLKEIADVCEIDKNLTTHVARHTFATTITLSNDVSIETVSAMLGHKSIRTTQIYAKVVEEKVSKEMNKLKEKLNK